MDAAALLYSKLLDCQVTAEEACKDDILAKISNALQLTKERLKSSRTAALWLQYMDMIDILRKFIRAERTGNWDLHLQALSEMLPFLAASGHNNYTKSVLYYLQQMCRLQVDHPDVYQHFQDGLHVIRRSDRYWAGLSSDLVIEQVLMRSMKTSGGLTRGRGMTEQQRVSWSLAMPACAEVNRAMQELTSVSFDSGEQNKDMAKSRQARDWKDAQTQLAYLQERNPFTCDHSLRSISTGVHAHSTVNVDAAKAVGNTILASMEGKTAADFSFKRSDQVITLSANAAVKIDGEAVHIDPQLLFQRLTIAAKEVENIESIFKYELCSYPPALFDSSLLLREPQKPALAKAIWDSLTEESSVMSGEVQFVLDGGSLLQRIPWTRGATYKEICAVYTDYVTKKYGEAIVVFDGYGESSTKDMVHQRRAKGQAGTTVTFTEDMKITMKKVNFLANSTNKQHFINLLGNYLGKKCKVFHAPGDADVLIVQKAVESALQKETALVGEDTDLLILLIFHASLDSHNIFFRPEPKKNVRKPKVWNIQAVKTQLGPEVCSNILFLHAILGCDTTSHLYGIGKGTALKKFKSSVCFRQQANVFSQESATAKEVCSAGEKTLLILYGGSLKESLDSLRYKRFCEKVSTSNSCIHPQTLPPTSAAAKYHSMRVYLQVLEWKNCSNSVNPLEWGWKESDGKFTPALTDLPPAPDNLLKMIRCNCRTDCSSMRCTCRKHNVKCSPACGNCRGSGCTNSTIPEQLDGDIDDETES